MKTHLATLARRDEPHRYSRAPAGFSIVEVMVALMVLAVGMLGIASLYVTTLRSSSSAISRMQAVNLAGDLADRIRSNRFAGAAYADDEPEAYDCTSRECTQNEMAENDLVLWQDQIDGLLGETARGEVTYTAGAVNEPDDYVVTVFWEERGNDGSGTNTSSTATEELSYVLTMQVEP